MRGIEGINRYNYNHNDKINYKVFWIVADRNVLNNAIYRRKIDMKNKKYNDGSRYLLDNYNEPLNNIYADYIIYNISTIEKAVEDTHRTIKMLEREK